jgi:hypothetical protein
MSRLLFGAFAVVSFLFSGTANAALYSQLSTPFVKTSVFDPIIKLTNAYVSQNDVSLLPGDPIIGIVSDNFRLTSDALVSKINWVGAYSVSSDGEGPTFEIGFYEDFFGLPGLEISSISGVTATETPLPDPGYFLYSANIAPVALMGNTNYWISVMANVPQVVDDWGWAITNADVNPLLRGSVQTYEGVFYQYPSTVVNGQVLNFPTVDFAFSLEGSGSAVIPEPMSALVFAGLLGGMAIYRRKKAISANAS